jgi:hypothetical protein
MPGLPTHFLRMVPLWSIRYKVGQARTDQRAERGPLVLPPFQKELPLHEARAWFVRGAGASPRRLV